MDVAQHAISALADALYRGRREVLVQRCFERAGAEGVRPCSRNANTHTISRLRHHDADHCISGSRVAEFLIMGFFRDRKFYRRDDFTIIQSGLEQAKKILVPGNFPLVGNDGCA